MQGSNIFAATAFVKGRMPASPLHSQLYPRESTGTGFQEARCAPGPVGHERVKKTRLPLLFLGSNLSPLFPSQAPLPPEPRVPILDILFSQMYNFVSINFLQVIFCRLFLITICHNTKPHENGMS